MLVSEQKSHFSFYCADEDLCNQIASIFPFPMSSINEGFRYLGFLLKSNNYGIADWNWLLKKFE